ncbi:MAG: hypothetical protein NTZ78_11720 [Candidatus Aureabacteria bacterium]|nr:hypothetical protein [Candidatus Auribacterota bacterium]
MRWNKKGLIYVADGEYGWAKTHAMLPTVDPLMGDPIRAYVTCRDEKGIGRIGCVELMRHDLSKIVAISSEPVLDIGEAGTFDENGVVAISLVNLPDGKKFLYYTGFELGYRIRYRLLSGLAVSSDNGMSFKRLQRTPILERSDKELYFRCASFVLLENDVFRMWYVAGSKWIEIDGKKKPVYTINYLESKDGIHWPQEGRVCIGIIRDEEHGFGRPYVIRDGQVYKMFYSIRVKGKGYRLGYAESGDGVEWVRRDEETGIDASEDGWDSEMICYSCILDIHGKRYMLYNGNGFGATGFGYAVLEPC